VACLGSFEMRREMSSRGEFQPIDPFAKGQVPSEVIEANHS